MRFDYVQFSQLYADSSDIKTFMENLVQEKSQQVTFKCRENTK